MPKSQLGGILYIFLPGSLHISFKLDNNAPFNELLKFCDL